MLKTMEYFCEMIFHNFIFSIEIDHVNTMMLCIKDKDYVTTRFTSHSTKFITI